MQLQPPPYMQQQSIMPQPPQPPIPPTMGYPNPLFYHSVPVGYPPQQQLPMQQPMLSRHEDNVAMLQAQVLQLQEQQRAADNRGRSEAIKREKLRPKTEGSKPKASYKFRIRGRSPVPHRDRQRTRSRSPISDDDRQSSSASCRRCDYSLDRDTEHALHHRPPQQLTANDLRRRMQQRERAAALDREKRAERRRQNRTERHRQEQKKVVPSRYKDVPDKSPVRRPAADQPSTSRDTASSFQYRRPRTSPTPSPGVSPTPSTPPPTPPPNKDKSSS